MKSIARQRKPEQRKEEMAVVLGFPLPKKSNPDLSNAIVTLFAIVFILMLLFRLTDLVNVNNRVLQADQTYETLVNRNNALKSQQVQLYAEANINGMIRSAGIYTIPDEDHVLHVH